MKTYCLYAITLQTKRPAQRFTPTSYFGDHLREFCAGYDTLMEAVDGFHQMKRDRAWPNDAEPEVRDLVEGNVVYFRRHDGAWDQPLPQNLYL